MIPPVLAMIVRMKFGSNLYGTQTPNSDTDYKGVYLPDIKDVITNKVSHNFNFMTKTKKDVKNGKDDVDNEIYSIQQFLKLAFLGETVALDMIHARDTIESTSPAREFLYENRAKLYQKNMKAYLGYCKGQAAKYGIKGSRLNECKVIVDLFKTKDPLSRLTDFWDEIPESEHVKKIVNPEHLNGDNRFLDVCGKQLQATARVENAIQPIQKFYEQYGNRARMAAESDGIDWKAISHAFRAALQLIEILETGDLKFPLKHADFIRDIKLGKYHYQNDRIGEQLDELIDMCNHLIEESDLPEHVDQDFWNEWLYSLYTKNDGL